LSKMRHSNLSRIILKILFFGSIANFVVFLLAAQAIGGDAISAQVIDGRYYFHLHGKVTEVSESVYIYSLWHVRSLFLTFPLGMLAAALLQKDRTST
jgi:hypothetical protein